MDFRKIISRAKSLVSVGSKAKTYMVYATIIIAILSIIGVAIQRNLNGKLGREKAALQLLNEDRAKANAELNAQLEDLSSITDATLAEVGRLREEESSALANLTRYGGQLAESRIETKALERQLEEAYEALAEGRLKDSFVAEQITNELHLYFPESEHVFFSETQDNLFKTNPETANLIYAVITENAVRIQLVEQLNGQVVTLTDLVETTEDIIGLRDGEILAYENLTLEFNETFDNLEAALSLERRTVSNLERQITIMNRKNLFERILPSLNIVIGPYYDPFRNQGGFAVALGLGWRF